MPENTMLKDRRERKCLACQVVVDDASDARGEELQPGPGYITVCFYCGHIMAFDDDVNLRELTSEEMYEVAGDKLILQIQEMRVIALREYQQWKKDHPDEPPDEPTG